jgi:hypothetical protein
VKNKSVSAMETHSNSTPRLAFVARQLADRKKGVATTETGSHEKSFSVQASRTLSEKRMPSNYCVGDVYSPILSHAERVQ